MQWGGEDDNMHERIHTRPSASPQCHMEKSEGKQNKPFAYFLVNSSISSCLMVSQIFKVISRICVCDREEDNF